MALIDVIKYEGGNETLVWKHPREDFNTEAQLIVHESQEAIIFKDGVASNVYGPGKYALKSDNIPGIKGLIALVTGGANSNHCEVYFINKAYSMNIWWGTTTPMNVQDPVWNIPLKIQAHGQFSVKVEESKKLLLKLVGTTNLFTSKALAEQFRGLLMSKIKEYICSYMIFKKKSFTNITTCLTDISEGVKDQISKVFVKYGLFVEELYVENISVEQDENYKKVMAAIAQATEQTIVGYTYGEQESFEVAKIQAANQGASGTLAGLAIGAGVGMAAGPMVGGMMNRSLQPAVNAGIMSTQSQKTPGTGFGIVAPMNNEKKCYGCGRTISADSNFCPYCGNVINAEAKCSQCGALIIQGAKYCSNCGAKQEV